MSVEKVGLQSMSASLSLYPKHYARAAAGSVECVVADSDLGVGSRYGASLLFFISQNQVRALYEVGASMVLASDAVQACH